MNELQEIEEQKQYIKKVSKINENKNLKYTILKMKMIQKKFVAC